MLTFLTVLTLLTLYFKLKTENANLRSGVQTKIQLKSALRSTLADKSIRSSISERSFIVRRGIFELLPVLSVSLYPPRLIKTPSSGSRRSL